MRAAHLLLPLLLASPAWSAVERPRVAEAASAWWSSQLRRGVDGARVLAASGELLALAVDVQVHGRAPGLAVTRLFRAGLAPGLLGPGWRLGLELRLETRGDRAVLVHPTGEREPAEGGRWTLRADPSGSLLVSADEQLRFDGAGRLVERRFRDGRIGVLVEYDAAGLPARVREHAGDAAVVLRCEQGRLRGVVDPLGRALVYAYDDAGRLASVTGPEGAVRYAYDAAGRLRTARGPQRRPLTADYDEAGRVIRLVSEGLEEHLRYERGAGAPRALAEVVVRGGQRVGLASDGARLELRAADAAASLAPQAGRVRLGEASLALMRDGAGRVRELRGQDGARFRLERDRAGRLTAVVDPAGARTELRWRDGRLVERADPGGGLTRYGYDDAGHLAEVAGPGGRLAFDHDALGRLTGVAGPGGAVTLGYDALDRLVSAAAGERRLSLEHGPRGPIAITDARGATTRLQLGPAGELEAIVDPLGRQLRAAPLPERPLRDGEVLRRDAWGRPLELANREERLRIEYDAVGRPTAVTSAQTGVVVRSRYDAAGRQVEQTAPGGVVRYGPEGLREERLPNGVRAALRWDGGRLAGLEVRRGDAAVLAQELTYDAGDLVTSVREAGAGAPARFDYDAAGQLVEATRGDVTTRYRYDPRGNLAGTVRDGQETEAAHEGARLTRWGEHRFAHDAEGRRVERAGPAPRQFAYTAGGLLREARDGAGHAVEYGYDPLGRRTRRSDAAGTRRYVWDGDRLAAELSGDGRVIARYVHGPGPDELLAIVRAGQTLFVHRDRRGSVRALTDAAGVVVARYRYGPFGEQLEASGPHAGASPLRWSGLLRDPATGLLYVRARDYDPETGRFLTPDPAGWLGGLNPYAYGANDPLNAADPSGLLPHAVVGAAIGAVLGAGTAVVLALLDGERPDWRDVVATTAAGAAIGGLFAGTAGMAFFAKSALARGSLWTLGGGMATGVEEAIANLLHRRPWHHDVARSFGLGAATGFAFFGAGNLMGRIGRAVARRLPAAAARGGSSAVAARGKVLLDRARTGAALLVDNVVIFTKSLLGRGGAPAVAEGAAIEGAELVGAAAQGLEAAAARAAAAASSTATSSALGAGATEPDRAGVVDRLDEVGAED